MDLEQLSEKYFHKTCRACMYQEKDGKQELLSIFEFPEKSVDMSIVELLKCITPQISFLELDNLPKQICSHCLGRLLSAHDFQQMCLRSDFHMRNLLHYGTVEPKYSRIAEGDRVPLQISTVDPLQAENTSEIYIAGELRNCLKLELHEEEVPCNFDFVDNSSIETKLTARNNPTLPILNQTTETSANIETNSDFELCDNRSEKGAERNTTDSEEGEVVKKNNCKKIFELKTEKDIESKDLDSNDVELERPNASCRRTISLPCPECGKVFDRSYSLSRHMSVHNPTGKPHECSKCKYRFATTALLKRHEVTHNINWTKANEAANSNPEGYKCNDCPRRFAKRESLSAHLQSHKKCKIINETMQGVNEPTSSETFTCDLCPKQFQKLKQLKRHSRTHEENKQFKCHLCDKAFASNAHLIDHVNKHNGVKPYVCKYCSKSFQQSCTLKDHVRIHTGEQPYLCSECGRAFNSSSNMKQHLLRHAGVKRYECPECPKKFPCLSDLASHMAVHKKIKPHICDVCGAAFGKPFQLKKHKMYHNGEKPHKCEYCEMRFVCADHMRRHMRTHTGEKPYKCKYCVRAFAQSNDLIKHLRSHIGENVYECQLCPKAFRLAAELREHFSLHKNDDEATRIKNAQELSEKIARNATSYVNTMCAIFKE